MDNEFLRQALGSMSDEEVDSLLNELRGTKEEHKDEKPVVDESKLADRLASSLVEKAAKEPKPAPVQQNHIPEFSQDEYAKLLIQDARKAQQYLELSTYGGHVSQLVPALAAATAALMQKVTELESGQFASRTPEYADPETRQVIDEVLKENGWEPNARNLKNAVAIAKGEGRIGQSEERPVREHSGPPPRLPRGRGKEAPQMSEETVLAAASRMSDEEMENFLIRAGLINERHLT